MRQSSSSLRAAFLGLVSLGLLVVIYRWSNLPGSSGAVRFDTPEACLNAFRDAKAAGNAEGYLRCLGEPLRSQTRRHFHDEQELGQALRDEMKVVKSWTVKERPESQAMKGMALVEEVSSSGVRELRMQLERTGDGWRIVALEQGKERPASLPYGTAVGKEPAGINPAGR